MAMASRSLTVLDLDIRGAQVAALAADDSVDSAVARSLRGDLPSWNDSTMCVQIIHRQMSAQGWHHHQPKLARYEGEVEELPRRPLDFGVGWWR